MAPAILSQSITVQKSLYFRNLNNYVGVFLIVDIVQCFQVARWRWMWGLSQVGEFCPVDTCNLPLTAASILLFLLLTPAAYQSHQVRVIIAGSDGGNLTVTLQHPHLLLLPPTSHHHRPSQMISPWTNDVSKTYKAFSKLKMGHFSCLPVLPDWYGLVEMLKSTINESMRFGLVWFGLKGRRGYGQTVSKWAVS